MERAIGDLGAPSGARASLRSLVPASVAPRANRVDLADEAVTLPGRGESVAVSHMTSAATTVSFAPQGVTSPDGVGDMRTLRGSGQPTYAVHAPVNGGVQILATAANAAQADRIRVASSIPAGTSWEKRLDGSVDLVRAGQDEPLGSLARPWAVDATGKTLPSTFVIEGTNIVQKVTTTGATFPVIADPSWVWWTKNIAVCVAQVASMAVPGKAVAVAAKLAKAAKTNAKVRSAYAKIKELGGVVETMKKIGTYVRTKGKGLSATNKKRLEAFFNFGGAVVMDILGLGGCWTVAKEIL